MRITNFGTGESYVQKRRRRFDEPGQARELTFSCYRRFQFLARDRTRQWFVEEMEAARREFPIDLWAYVIMPEHVHMLVYPREPGVKVGVVEGRIKEKVARRAIKFLEEHAPQWIPRITVHEGQRVRRRFWQPGGGYDRNITSTEALRAMIDYIHANPVRRGLVARAEDWEWSSARWYAGQRPVKLEMDHGVLPELASR